MLITCKELLSLVAVARNSKIDVLEFLGALLMITRSYGRVYTSKRLGIRERVVRRVADISKSISGVPEIVAVFEKMVLERKSLSCTPILYTGLSEELIQKTRSAVVGLRDRIVIFSRDPSKIEVIGVLNGCNVEYPGVPPELLRPYEEVTIPALNKGVQRGLVVCWRNYRDELDDAALLAALGSLCETSSSN